MARDQLKAEECIVVVQDDNGASTVLGLVRTEASEEDGRNLPFELVVDPASPLAGELPSDLHASASALPARLDPSRSTIYVLISTGAGTGLAAEFSDRVLAPLLRALGLGGAEKVIRTSSAESVVEFAREVLLAKANEAVWQTVILLSGDGGVVDIVNGILETGDKSSSYVKPILALLPLGTGNALFNSLHRSSDLPSIYIQGLRTLVRGTPQPLPIFQATFSTGARLLSDEGRRATPLPNNRLYGAVVASYGLHATLVADSDTAAWRAHGDKRFGLVAQDLLFPAEGESPHAYQAAVVLSAAGGGQEEHVLGDSHGYVLASMVSNLEKTFTISPASGPLDGTLRVVSFPPVSGAQATAIMTAAYNAGAHVGMEWDGATGRERVGYASVSGLRIDLREPGAVSRWRRCCVDGVIVDVEEGGWMDVRLVERGGEVVDVVVADG